MNTFISKLIVVCMLGLSMVETRASEAALHQKGEVARTMSANESRRLSATRAGTDTRPEERRGALLGGLVGAGLGGPFGAGVGVIVGGGWLGKLVGLHRVNAELGTQVEVLAEARASDEAQYRREVARLSRALVRAESQKAVVESVAIQFRTASATLESHYQSALEDLAIALANSRDARVVLSGFADRRGDADYNLKLSEDRVAEVRRFLLAHGVTAAQIETRAFGESMPVSESGSPEDYFFDRRVVMELVDSGSSGSDKTSNSRGVAVR
ncbi:MAG: OmpA family protein [Pseudomonadota bacterium]